MRAPLWLDVKSQGRGATATVSLAVCRNCGKVKAVTNPCSFDHLAAVMEFGRYLDPRGAVRADPPEATRDG